MQISSSDKGYIFRMYKELLHPVIKTTQLKNGKILKNIFY